MRTRTSDGVYLYQTIVMSPRIMQELDDACRHATPGYCREERARSVARAIVHRLLAKLLSRRGNGVPSDFHVPPDEAVRVTGDLVDAVLDVEHQP